MCDLCFGKYITKRVKHVGMEEIENIQEQMREKTRKFNEDMEEKDFQAFKHKNGDFAKFIQHEKDLIEQPEQDIKIPDLCELIEKDFSVCG